jgi:hypothetical protein
VCLKGQLSNKQKKFSENIARKQGRELVFKAKKEYLMVIVSDLPASCSRALCTLVGA